MIKIQISQTGSCEKKGLLTLYLSHIVHLKVLNFQQGKIQNSAWKHLTCLKWIKEGFVRSL